MRAMGSRRASWRRAAVATGGSNGSSRSTSTTCPTGGNRRSRCSRPPDDAPDERLLVQVGPASVSGQDGVVERSQRGCALAPQVRPFLLVRGRDEGERTSCIAVARRTTYAMRHRIGGVGQLVVDDESHPAQV